MGPKRIGNSKASLGSKLSLNSNSVGSSKRSRQQSSVGNSNMNATEIDTKKLVTAEGQYICYGCSEPIKSDKFILKACERYWHEACLKCDECKEKLCELGTSLYCKSNLHLCRRDYLSLFGSTGVCSVCDKSIHACEMVMRAKRNVYHLECFACQLCNLRFCVGERFYLYENKIVCQYDYEEHILPIENSLLKNPSASNKSQLDEQSMTDTLIMNENQTSYRRLKASQISIEHGAKLGSLEPQETFGPNCSEESKDMKPEIELDLVTMTDVEQVNET